MGDATIPANMTAIEFKEFYFLAAQHLFPTKSNVGARMNPIRSRKCMI
jgi:hypothetical protein